MSFFVIGLIFGCVVVYFFMNESNFLFLKLFVLILFLGLLFVVFLLNYFIVFRLGNENCNGGLFLYVVSVCLLWKMMFVFVMFIFLIGVCFGNLDNVVRKMVLMMIRSIVN